MFFFAPSIIFYSSCARVAPKLITPILLCWPTTSEADVDDMAVEVEPSRQYSVKFGCRAPDDSRGDSLKKMASDMEVRMKQRRIIDSITTNEMQRYTIFFIVVSAVHISSGFSAHHQELKNCTCSIGY
jgi:hypothetical protein